MIKTKLKYALLAILTASIIGLSGCETLNKSVMSDDDIKGATAGVLGVQPAEVALSQRREQDGVTYYLATIKNGTYACTITGGTIFTWGTYATPKCTKKDQ